MRLTKRGPFWHYSFTIAGRRIRASTKTTDKRLAAEIASTEENRQRSAAIHGPAAVLTFGEAVALYLQAKKSPRFLLPILDAFGQTRVASLSGDALRRTARTLYPFGCAATLNRQFISPTQAVINHAADLGYCARISVRRFKVDKRERLAGDWPWIEAFHKASNQASKPGIGAMALLMFTTGARIGQATRLTWAGIDMSRSTVTLPAAKGHGAREAHLVPETLAAIASLSLPGLLPRDKVFGYATKDTAHKHWNKIVKLAGLPKLTPHEAGRHGFGTQMIVRAGVDPVTAARAGGWASPRVMLDTYAHASKSGAAVASAFAKGKGK